MNSLSVAAYVAYVGVKAFLASFRNDVELFCTTCGHEGEPRTHTKVCASCLDEQ